jgi:hypothetical protein
MLNKAVTDGPTVHPGRSTRTLKMNFTEPITFDFFWFSTSGRSALRGRTVHEDAKNEFYRTQHLRFFLVFNEQTVRTKRSNGPRLVPDGAVLSFG